MWLVKKGLFTEEIINAGGHVSYLASEFNF